MYYLFYGLGQAAHTVTQQTIVADFFGPRRYATLRGIMNPITVGGGVLGPLFAGMMFDAQDSYQLAFLIMGPLVALGAPTIFLAGKPRLVEDPLEARKSRQHCECKGVEYMPRMTGGQALAKSLHREGVRVIFGLPGVQLYHALDPLYDEPEHSLDNDQA